MNKAIQNNSVKLQRIVMEVLVWSNDPEARPNHMLGTDDNFTLTNYSLDKLV